MPATTVSTTIRVRYAELAGDHVYYANYLGWVEANMGQFYRKYNVPWLGHEQAGIRTMVAESFGRFIRPARYDDAVTVTTAFTAAAPKRAYFEHEISRDGEQIAQFRTTHVLMAAGRDGVQPIPDQILQLAGRRAERVGVLDDPADFPDPDGPGPAPLTAVEFPVRYKETDAAGAVYFSNHYVYFEVGRTELLRSIGMPFTHLKADGLRLPVARAYCRYLAPISYGDAILVKTWIACVKKVQLTFRCDLIRKSDGATVASGFTIHGCTDPAGKPIRVPDAISKCVG